MATRTALYLDGMQGFGDTMYQRPFVRAASLHHDLWVSTSWPEIYRDLPVKFVKPQTLLRTQTNNIRRQPPVRWSPLPKHARTIQNRYGKNELGRGISIPQSMEQQIGLFGEPFIFDLPSFPPFIPSMEKPIAVIRPVTLRREWPGSSRAPRPEYLEQAATLLAKDHHCVSVADVKDTEEWYLGNRPFAHQRFDHGELSVEQLLGLLQQASVVIGGVGWIVPAALAARRRLGCVLGGRGKHNAPKVLMDARMDSSRVRWFTPDHFCLCEESAHACDKEIRKFDQQFAQWMGEAA